MNCQIILCFLCRLSAIIPPKIIQDCCQIFHKYQPKFVSVKILAWHTVYALINVSNFKSLQQYLIKNVLLVHISFSFRLLLYAFQHHSTLIFCIEYFYWSLSFGCTTWENIGNTLVSWIIESLIPQILHLTIDQKGGIWL